MAQRIFQSFRRLPGQFSAMRRKQDSIEVVGNHYKINMFSNVGFPAKPASLAYDYALNIFALVTKDGLIYVYGKPGIVYVGSHQNASEIINVMFLNGTGKLLTLSDRDDIYIWQLESVDGSQPCVKQICNLSAVTQCLEQRRVDVDQNSTENTFADVACHVTALYANTNGTSIYFGTENGHVALIHKNTQNKRGTLPHGNEVWTLPTYDESISPQRVLQTIPSEKRARLRLDAVVVLSERPGFVGQLLIGYNSGVSLIYDLHADCVLALLPWQYGLEAATWCGGSGLPIRNASSRPMTQSPQLGTRLLTAHADGSLGVWRVPVFSRIMGDQPAQILSMEEAPSMPYGPFPCKLISKVFWVPSHRGGITIFAGGMPRSTYGDRSTVSILRGSNLDQAAAANLAAAVRLAHADGDLEDDEDEDEAEFEEEDHANLLASGLVPGAPVHVFDADAPEHVCLDLPSPLVDICPLGPSGGPATGVLILCEEELVAVDLLTPGWPLLTLPYLSCLHTSAISAYSLFTQVNPAFLERLDAVAECGKGDALGLGRRETGYSKRPWPVQGGQCILPGSGSPSRGDLSIDPAHSLVTSTDLLVTGHENGTVAFWRLGPGGCARKVFTLYTGSLFDGEFGPDAGGDSRRDGDDENDPWPPFRRAGLFDPFMDDPRAAVKCIQLVENTLVVGGAAGQVTVWQFADERPVVRTVDVPIVQEIPGFRWKGHAPLKLRPQGPSRSPGMSLYPVGIALAQPPAQITSLAVCELPTTTTTTASAPAGAPSEPAKPGVVVVGFGTPHGFGLVHWASQPSDLTAAAAIAAGNADSSPGLILAQSTIPFNSEALEEAAVGEGWARRRTRELKNSLRDSFRRLKRMRSTSSIRRAPSNASASSSTTAPVTTVARPPASHMSARVGLRRSVTQSRPAVMQVSGDPLQEAIQRSQPHSDAAADLPMPSGGEREICDRPVETASTAVVRCVAFGPALHRIRAPAGTPVLLGSFFVSTSGGATNVYALFADRANQPSQLAVRHASELILHHRAPVIALRLIDTKTYIPFSPNSIGGCSPASSNSPPPPHLVIVSEEQVRLFSLPSLHLRHKVRITAKDGFRIKAASIVTFQQTPQFDGCFDKMAGALGDGTTTSQHQPSQPIGLVRGNLGPEFGLVFTNNGGQAVVLSIPYLRRRDAIPLLGPQDLLAVNSVAFATNGSASSTALPPSLGVYQLAHGQLTLFDVVLAGQKASAHGLAYRALYRIRPITDLAEQDSPANRVASMPSPRAGRTNNVSGSYLSARNTAGSPLSTRSGQTGSDVANQSGSSPGQNRSTVSRR